MTVDKTKLEIKTNEIEKIQVEKIAVDNTADSDALLHTGQSLKATSANLVGTSLDGKIQIEALIGQGGMSMVYKGTHLVLNRPVAVKVIIPQVNMGDKLVLRLQQEARAAYSLSHKNLASVHDVSLTADGLPYLVMDFAEGETLAEMLTRGPLQPAKAIDIFSQICAGLAAAHEQRVIHRDIKPGNIMVEHLADGGENVKIVDFGIAKKVTENAEEIHKLTQTGEVFGTPLYMSPEQCRGERLDARSDVYAVGCVLYEALTGAPPFKGDSAIGTIMQHLEKPAPTPAKALKIPASLTSVVLRCLEKKSADRYQSVEEIYKDLQAIKDGGKLAKKYIPKHGRAKRPNIGAILIMASVGGLFIAAAAVEFAERFLPDYKYSTIQTCNEKIAKNPHDEKAYLYRANLNMQDNQWARAVVDYTECLKTSRNPTEVYAFRSSAYIKIGRYKEALDDCNKALEINPRSNYALVNRATANLMLHHSAEALADADSFLKINPNDTNVLCTRARALTHLGRFNEAIETCNESIRLKPTSSEAFSDRAWAYAYLRNSTKAIEDATTVIGLNRDPRAYIARGWGHYQRHEYEQALSDLNIGLEIHAKDAQGLVLKALTLTALGRAQEAMPILDQVAQVYPKFESLYSARAAACKSLGKLEEAEQALKTKEEFHFNPAFELAR
jgi:tetratricopeptide (TPR) repeat protein/tRNA A-37 threonylcarbamoyl transferase component Bud32